MLSTTGFFDVLSTCSKLMLFNSRGMVLCGTGITMCGVRTDTGRLVDGITGGTVVAVVVEEDAVGLDDATTWPDEEAWLPIVEEVGC